MNRNIASLVALKKARGKLASFLEEKLDIFKDCFFSGKDFSNEDFKQQDLTTNEIRKCKLLSQTLSSVKEIAANQPITSLKVGNAIIEVKVTCKAFDPGGFQPKLLKHSELFFQLLLTRLFNIFLDKEN